MKPFLLIVLAMLSFSVQAQQKIYLYKSGIVIDKYLTSEVDSIIFYATVPVLSTLSVSDVTISSARTGGFVSSDGGEEVTERGVCWNASGNPTYTDNKSSGGTGTGSFEVVITGLVSGQTYYVRAYAKNSEGLSYGNQLSFTTLSAVAPVITIDPAVSVSTGSATVQVSGLVDGGSTITAKGVVWSKSYVSPDLNNKEGFTNEGSGASDFSSILTNLAPNTLYYARAYASNAIGTGYSNAFSFTTSELIVVDAEGNEYGTITAGNLTWMTQNLRTTKFNNNQVISDSWDYDNNPANRNLYGRLYTWTAANDGRNACPAGWRLPSSEEWNHLMEYLRDNGYPSTGEQVKAISAKTGWANSTYEGTPGYQPQTNNGSGFSAVPAGKRTAWGYEEKDYVTWWWTSEDWTDNPAYGYYKSIKYDQNYMVTYVDTKETGFSVRCVKEAGTDPTPVKPSVSTEGATNINTSSATINGKVISDGGAAITQRGFYWSETNANPDQSANVEIVSGTTGDFSMSIGGLKENTTYYYKAFASNSMGTATGDVKMFTAQSSGGDITDQRDGNVYKTVNIGGQVWMAENLKYLPSVSEPSAKSTTTPYYYVYGYSGTNVNIAKTNTNYSTYGVLYNWPAAMASSASSNTIPSRVQGACPSGWHLPSDAEWTQLVEYLGGIDVAGGKLKEIGTTHWQSPNSGATNETGFTALPGGARFYDGAFDQMSWGGNWWSATEKPDYTTSAWFYGLSYYSSEIEKVGGNKELGFSVRCMKD